MIHLQPKENKRETSMCKTASFICEAFVVYGFNYQLFQIVILVRISEVLICRNQVLESIGGLLV